MRYCGFIESEQFHYIRERLRVLERLCLGSVLSVEVGAGKLTGVRGTALAGRQGRGRAGQGPGGAGQGRVLDAEIRGFVGSMEAGRGCSRAGPRRRLWSPEPGAEPRKTRTDT